MYWRVRAIDKSQVAATSTIQSAIVNCTPSASVTSQTKVTQPVQTLTLQGLFNAYGSRCGTPKYVASYDANKDCTINLTDYIQLRSSLK